MAHFDYDAAAECIQIAMPNCARVAILGSTSFWDPESEATCQQIGVCFADISGLTLVTGGMSGVADTVGRSFYAGTRQSSGDSRVVHVLPVGCSPRPYGVTLYAGEDMYDRREVLGRLASLYVIVEGGPGTAHETNVAQSRGSMILPVGRSGGVAAELYRRLPCPPAVDMTLWSVLNEVSVHPKSVAEAVKSIVSRLLHISDN